MDAGRGDHDTSLPLLGVTASVRLSATTAADRSLAPPIPKEAAVSLAYHSTRTATVNRLGERLFAVAVPPVKAEADVRHGASAGPPLLFL